MGRAKDAFTEIRKNLLKNVTARINEKPIETEGEVDDDEVPRFLQQLMAAEDKARESRAVVG